LIQKRKGVVFVVKENFVGNADVLLNDCVITFEVDTFVKKPKVG